MWSKIITSHTSVGSYVASNAKDVEQWQVKCFECWEDVRKLKHYKWTIILLKELKGHNENIRCLAWSRDSNMLASSGQDGLLKLWDVQKASDSALLQNGPMANNDLKSESTSFATKCTNIIGLSYSPHNTLLATGIAAAANNPLKTKNNTLWRGWKADKRCCYVIHSYHLLWK